MTEELDQFENRLTGVKGWLFIFCFTIAVIRPILVFYSISSSWAGADRLFKMFPELEMMLAINGVIDAILIIWGVAVGIKLWTIAKDAVHFTRNYLIVLIAYALLSIGLIFVFDFPAILHGRLVDASIEYAIKTILYSGFWLIYFSVSNRVNFTYTQQEETGEQEDTKENTNNTNSINSIFINVAGGDWNKQPEVLTLLHKDFGGEEAVKIVNEKAETPTPDEDDASPKWNTGITVSKHELSHGLIKKLLGTFHGYSAKLEIEFVVGYYDDINDVLADITMITPSSDKEDVLTNTLIYF